MKTEELKLIIELLAALGDSGKEAFIWWLIMDKGLGFLSVVITVITAAVCGYRLVMYLNGDDDKEQSLRRLRDAMGIGTEGIVIKSELDAMIRWIDMRRTK